MTSEIAQSLWTFLLEATLASSFAIVLVLVLRAPVRRTFGARNAYALWLLVPAALIAVLVPREEIVAGAPPSTEAPIVSDLTAGGPAFSAHESAVSQPPLPDGQPVESTQKGPAKPSTTISEIAGKEDAFALNKGAVNFDITALFSPLLFVSLWVVGVACSLALLFWRQRRLVNELGRLSPIESKGRHIFQTAVQDFGPALIGLLRPRLILPANFEKRYTRDEQSLILAHEQRHLDVGDVQINGLTAFLSALFWFNPLMRLAQIKLRLDQEIACDADVIARDSVQKQAYANALLKAQLAGYAVPLGAAWPAKGSNPLKARVTAMKKSVRGPGARLAGAGLVLAMVAASSSLAWTLQPSEKIYLVGNEFAQDIPVPSPSVMPLPMPAPKPEPNLTAKPVGAVGAPGLVGLIEPNHPSSNGESFIDQMRDAGLQDLSVEDLIALKIHGATPSRISWMKDLGINTDVQTIVEVLISGLTRDDVIEAEKALGKGFRIRDLISLKNTGGNPSDIRRFQEMGLKNLSLKDVMSLTATGVSERFLKALKDEGLDISDPDEVVELMAVGVSIDFVKKAKKAGFKDLTLSKLWRLKAADVL